MQYVKHTTDSNCHYLTWSLPALPNNTAREFRTSKSEKCTECFQLKIRFCGNIKEVMDIYYLSPNPVISKIVLNKVLSWQIAEIARKEYHIIDANKWQKLVSIGYDTSSSYKLVFQFSTFNRIVVPETEELGNDFQNLLNKGLFSDVTIISDEGTEYKAHKAVLAIRSAMLNTHFELTTSANVLESPFKSEVVNEVLTFIYSDQAPKVDENPEKLVAAADFYQLSKLKGFCEEALHKKLTIENAIETLQLAHLHSANTLMQHTLEFIKNHAKAVTKTEQWANITSVELIKIIFEYNMEEDVVYIDIEENE